MSLESLEALEASASDLEGQLDDAEMITALTSIDLLSLRAKVTSVKTTIVTLRTDAERLRWVTDAHIFFVKDKVSCFTEKRVMERENQVCVLCIICTVSCHRCDDV